MLQSGTALKEGRSQLAESLGKNHRAKTGTVGESTAAQTDEMMETAKAKDGQTLTAHERTVANGGKTALAAEADVQKTGAERKCTGTDGFNRIGQGYGTQGRMIGESTVADSHNRAALGILTGNQKRCGLGAGVTGYGAGVLGKGSIGKELGILGHINTTSADVIGFRHNNLRSAAHWRL